MQERQIEVGMRPSVDTRIVDVSMHYPMDKEKFQARLRRILGSSFVTGDHLYVSGDGIYFRITFSADTVEGRSLHKQDVLAAIKVIEDELKAAEDFIDTLALLNQAMRSRILEKIGL